MEERITGRRRNQAGKLRDVHPTGTRRFQPDRYFISNNHFSLTALNDSEDGTWELTDNNDTLILDGEEMTIVKLTKDELVPEGEEVDDEYGIYSATLHLKR